MRIQEKLREDDVLIRVVGVNDEEGNDDYSDCLLRDVQQLFKESI